MNTHLTPSLAYLCHQDSLIEGEPKGFSPWESGRDEVIAIRWNGKIKIYRNLCPHQNVALHYQKDRFMSGDRQYIVCFAHGARFRPQDGVCIKGPCQNQALQSLGYKIDEQGNVWVVDALQH